VELAWDGKPWVSELDLLSLVGYQKREVDKNRSDETENDCKNINEKVV